MSGIWTAAEAAAATGGTAEGTWIATGLSIDSRTVAPGDLFVALAGPTFDGHRFALAALQAGAAAVAVAAGRAPDPGLERGAPRLEVGDTMEALNRLGVAARARTKARIVGVTGSVGKTGTKEGLALALSAFGRTHASVGSFNNHWGVPVSLARMPRDAAFAVLEMGMNHPGELSALTALARPTVALVTTIEAAHLAFFSGVESIADAKAEIFEGLPADGVAVLNRDNGQFVRLEGKAKPHRVLSFGSTDDCAIRLERLHLDPQGSDIEAVAEGVRLRYRIGLPGRHWALNSLGVIGVALALGLDPARAATALAHWHAPAGRGRHHTISLAGGAATLIDESYNASPAAMRAAFALLAMSPAKRRIAVLGEMRELGDEAAELHLALAPALTASGVDIVLTVGPEMRHLAAALPAGRHGGHADTAVALLPLLRPALRDGDVVLVKGSLGTRMADIVKSLLESSPAASHEAAA